MRTALLSTLELTDEGAPRAYELLGGKPLIAWQIDLMRSLGCDRIICIARSGDEKMQEIRSLVEESDLEFQSVSGPLPLVGLISADQELLVMADGLIVDREALPDTFGSGRSVLTLPDDVGITAGFERIDSEHAWGGLLLARGSVAAHLADMPPDSDTVSLLLRLALQSGAQLTPVDPDALKGGEWMLVRNSASLEGREQALLDRSVEKSNWSAPSIALGQRIARALAPDGLARGPLIASAIGTALGLGALALSYFDARAAALVTLGIGAFALFTGISLANLKARLFGASVHMNRTFRVRLLIDVLLVAVLSLPFGLSVAPRALFLPVLFVFVLRLAERLGPDHVNSSFGDRAVIAILLAVPAWFGMLEQALAGLSLLTLASCLFFQRNSKITRA